MSIKLSIVSAGALPIPTVRGGGVETLIQFFIDENEVKKDFEIVLYTVAGAESLQGNYKQTRFVNIIRKPWVDKLIRRLNPILFGVNRRTFQIPFLRLLDSYEKQVIQYLKNDCSDVVMFENNLTLLLRKKTVNSKIVFHAHYDDVRPNITEFEKKRYRYCYSKIDANISVSSFITQRVRKVIGSKSLLYTVHNCVDIERFRNITTKVTLQAKRKLGIPDGMPVVMYSGRITEEKGVEQLLSAFQRVKSEACLVIVGGVYYSDNSENDFLIRIKKMAELCQNPVLFTGYIDYSDMPAIWSVADIAVVPTFGVEEAAGLVVIEAMAAGKPVILSDSGAMREYANEKSSFVIKRDDSFVEVLRDYIEYLCQNKDVCVQMGIEAQRTSLNWCKERYYCNMSDTLKKICECGELHE